MWHHLRLCSRAHDGDTINVMGQGKTWTDAQRASRLQHLLERNRSQHQGEFKYEDGDWMRDAYLTRRMSYAQMADEASCGTRTIARWMRTHGIPVDQTKKPVRRSGEDHPRWNGGKPKCDVCGSPCTRRGGPCFRCRDISGDKGSNWKGDAVGYTGMHYRVFASRGRAAEHQCQHCSRTANEWAYDHSDPGEKLELVGRDRCPYSLDISHYIPLCVTCHRRFDLGG